MRYQVIQKMLAVGGDYTVRNEQGREIYYFDGKVFSLGGKKIVVLNEQRKEVAQIRKKVFALGPTYLLRRNGRVAAVIKKKPFTFRTQFVIDVPGTNDYTVVGDYLGHEYTIRRGSHDVARVSKRFFGSTDSYGVDVSSGDPETFLAAVIVIDIVLYKKVKS